MSEQTVQQYIDDLIVYIDEAIARHSVSNRHVAAVLSFLNTRLKDIDQNPDLLSTFLRKDEPDVASFLIKFLGGIEVGNFVSSLLSGHGAKIDANGNAEFESLTVRSSAVFKELVYNRLSAVESSFVFTESGTIESVESIANAPNSFLLTLQKRWEHDFTAFAANDVLLGSVNTMAQDGTYYTSWLRVSSVNVYTNQITVIQYDGEDVPAGTNFVPSAGMRLCRWGNALDETRQSNWYISSHEGCMAYLDGVTAPILSESNYSMIIGKLKHLEIFTNLPINYAHSYIYARGIAVQNLFRIDYQGVPSYDIEDAGLWQSDGVYIRGLDSGTGRYIQHQVWHGSCCWRCAVARATVGQAPRWNNADWVCIVGDASFALALDSSAGNMFRVNSVVTTLSARITQGTMDITADIADEQFLWERLSTQAAEDVAWNVARSASGRSLSITNADMPSDWYSVRTVSFRCTVTIRDGESYSINCRIN